MWHEFFLQPVCEGNFDMKSLLSIFEQSNAFLWDLSWRSITLICFYKKKKEENIELNYYQY